MSALHPTWGFDYPGDVTRLIPRVLRAGLGFVGRYYGGSDAKDLHVAEMRAITSAGLGVLSYYEARGDQIDSFSQQQGRDDAQRAAEQATAAGQPEGTGIHFCVDLDADAAQEAASICPYFEGAHAILDGHYDVCGYGSGLTAETLTARGLVSHFVLGAVGWRDGHAFLPRASVVQKPPSDPYGFGVQVDPLYAQRPDFGAWRADGPLVLPDFAPPVPAARVLALGEVGDDVRVLQARLGIAVDGVFGPATLRALEAFQKVHGLITDGRVVPGTPTAAALAT